MEKRLFLAIIISILVLMLYSTAVSRFQPSPLQDSPATVPEKTQSNSLTSKTQPIEANTILIEPAVSKTAPLEIIQNEDMTLAITPYGTGINNIALRHFDTTLSQTNIGLLTEWQAERFEGYSINNGILMSYEDAVRGIEIKKSYKFTKDNYIVEMVIEFISTSDTKSYIKYNVGVGSMSDELIKNNPVDQRYIECVVALPNKIMRSNFLKLNPGIIDGPIQWVGIRDRYFCIIMRPLQEAGILLKNNDNLTTSYLLQVPQFEVLPGETIKHSYNLYLGPQKPEFITNFGLNAVDIINYGFFDALSHILLGALKALYKMSNNWGVAIILFSLLVFLVMSPLSIKSFKSMKHMQEMQPIIEELKVKYKDNPQKMNREVMEIYREKKINPLGGCLPMFLQMPIFIALYQTLMRFVDLKGARFLWIKDLSEPDRLAILPRLPDNFPVIGNELNLLPLIMIATMLLQQKLTSTKQLPTSGSSAQQQKMMSLFMAVFFGIIFYKMPAGLVLYWAVNSIAMLVFQAKVIGRSSTKSE